MRCYDYRPGSEIYLRPCLSAVTLSEAYSVSEPLFFCHQKGSDAMLFSRLPEREGGADSFHLAHFLYIQELETTALRSLVYGGKHQICTNGKKENTPLTAAPFRLRFDQEQTAASLQSLTNATAEYVGNQTEAQTLTNNYGY